MSRQTDVKVEERDTKRRDSLFKALEYSLPGALEFHGMELLGLAIKYEPFQCTLTLKAIRKGFWSVAFISSDSMSNCILAADSAARRGTLKWIKDKYHPDEV